MRVSAFLAVVAISGAAAGLLAGGCGSSNSGGGGGGMDSGLGGEAGYAGDGGSGFGGEAGYGGSDGGGPVGGPPLPPQLESKLEELGTTCIQLMVNYDGDPIEWSLIEAGRAAYAQGATDIALSQSGCTRMYVDRDGATVKSAWIVAPPFVVVALDPRLPPFFLGSLSAWVPASTGEGFFVDADGDGYFEHRENVEYEKKAVIEAFAQPTNSVSWRRTVTVTADSRFYDIKDERFDTGGAPVTTTSSAPISQKACDPAGNKPPPKDPTSKQPADVQTRPCTPDERSKIWKSMGEANLKGNRCLWALGKRDASDKVLHTFIRGEPTFECTDEDQGFIAANDRGFANLFPDQYRMIFHSDFFTKDPLSAQAAGTAFHELLHFVGTHDGDLEAAASEANLRLTDPTYACEYACFGDNATECHMAACLGKTMSTSWKGKKCTGTLDDTMRAKLEKARGKPLAGCATGHQVGALCRSFGGGANVLFCGTLLECEGMCQDKCESKSLSCLDDCR